MFIQYDEDLFIKAKTHIQTMHVLYEHDHYI